MAVGDIIVGVDLGTSKVSTVVGEVNNVNQVEVLSAAEERCSSIKKSDIVDETEMIEALKKVVHQAEEQANMKIGSTYVTIPGKHITIVQNTITKEAKDKYSGISSRDVIAAISQVKDIEIPEDKVLIDIVPDKFKLENGEIVEDPVGNLSDRFTLFAQIILADKSYVKKVSNIFKKLDIEIDGFAPITLAERNVVLDTNELADNILLLDIGAGNTDMGVFEGSSFLYTNTIPVGGDHITNDISLVLDISHEEAERLKMQYGLALKSFIDNDNTITLNTYKGIEKTKTIKSSELVEIIEARVEEIFSLVAKDLTTQGWKSKINNVVLTGRGISHISKSDVAGKISLNIPVKMATGRMISTISSEYRTAYSLVKYVAGKPFAKTVSSSIDVVNENNIFRTVVDRIKDFFYT